MSLKNTQFSFKANPLPYDMGNAGDLIKHGILGEYTNWWIQHFGKMTYIDPFAGRLWQEPINSEVSRRLVSLEETVLFSAQPDYLERYYGSVFIVKNIIDKNHDRGQIFVSDRNSLALQDFISTGLDGIASIGFNPEDAYSILNSDADPKTSLILLDPFDDFAQQADKHFKNITRFIYNQHIPILLFILTNNNTEAFINDCKQQYLKDDFVQISITCPAISNSSVKGESRFKSETLLLLPQNKFHEHISRLKEQIINLYYQLETALETRLTFKIINE